MAFQLEDAEHILVNVHQVVCDLNGSVVADEHVGHRFTLAQGLIKKKEVCPLPPFVDSAFDKDASGH